jgi:SHS2 domain-containing protein
MSFETFGTAGDAGLRAEARTLPELLSELALGFASLSCPALLSAPDLKRVAFHAAEPGELAVKFLNELVYLADTEGFLPAEVSASVTPAGGGLELKAELKGETAAFDRRPRGLLVKAATYHGLKVEEKDGRWRAEIVLDI